MAKYKVLASSLSWISDKKFKKGEVIEPGKYWKKDKIEQLERRGFIEPIQEAEAEAEKSLSSLKNDELKAIIEELGSTPEGSTKAEYIEQIEKLKEAQSE